MRRSLILALALALGGCASCPAPAPVRTAADSSLASSSYALAGKVDSLLVAGKLSSQTAVRLNTELRAAQADLRAGRTAEARALIDSVKGEIP